MSRFTWMEVASALLLSGCAATSTMVGVREPDITQIKPTDQRSKVERLLGERLWRAGSSDGVIYDIYEYKMAQPAHPLLGSVWLSMDVLSLGTMTSARGISQYSWPVKQVAVAYDARDQVLFVSRPWSVNAAASGDYSLGTSAYSLKDIVPPPCRRMRSLLPADSGVPSNSRPSLLALAGSSSEVSTLKLDWLLGIKVTIDGRELEGRVIELPPGGHTVNDAEVEFLPGRKYGLKFESFGVGISAWEEVNWIEDVDSAETLFCFPPRYTTQ